MDEVDQTALDILREISQCDESAAGELDDTLSVFEDVAADDFNACTIAEAWARDARHH